MIIDIPSGHHGRRRENHEIQGVVLHAIGEWVVDATNVGGKGNGYVWHCTDWLRAIGRSCHAFVLPDGRIVREVDTRYKAWHARGFNTAYCGIEFALPGVWPYGKFQKAMDGLRPEASYTEAQIKAGVEWCRARALEHDFQITNETVRTHQQVDPGRKKDPGAIFPLDEFIGSI